jgi:[protein-PII] uridylyltransferase
VLYRIASAIADTGLSIVTARIATEKGAALDTFYLCDKNGKKIESDDVLRKLTREVRARIAP